MMRNQPLTSRHNTRRRGFALLEVLISLEVFAFGIVPIVVLYPAILGAMSTGVRKSAAAEIAQGAVEEMIRLNYDDQVPSALRAMTKQNASWPETLNFTRTVSVEYVDPHSLAVVKSNTRLKKITVIVTWMDRGRMENLTYSTLSSAYD